MEGMGVIEGREVGTWRRKYRVLVMGLQAMTFVLLGYNFDFGFYDATRCAYMGILAGHMFVGRAIAPYYSYDISLSTLHITVIPI